MKKIRIISIALFLISINVSVNIAAPLRFVPVTVTQPNGAVLHIFASGDEFHNWLHDEHNYTIIQNPATGYYVYAVKNADEIVPGKYVVGKVDPRLTQLERGVNISPELMLKKRNDFYEKRNPLGVMTPSHGSVNNIVIFIRFSDEDEFGEVISSYNTIFNNSTTGANSMYNYFVEASYGQLEITTTFYPSSSGGQVVSYKDTYPRSYYKPYSENNPSGYSSSSERTSREHTLLENAVNEVKSQIPETLDIDSDNDGYVDGMVFIVSGGPTGWSDLLWPHAWSLYSKSVYINGSRVMSFNFQLQDRLVQSGVGVLCHEMMHSLGAPDLYHYTGNGIAPAGIWDVMEGNSNPPQHPLAYMKYRYTSWIEEIPEITEPGTYSLNPLISELNNCYKIASPRTLNEYFVVEYRRRIGTFENSLPGSGIIVYRINTARDGHGNAGGPPDEVYVYRPGGTRSANGNVSNAFFSSEAGRTVINHSTDPYPFLSDGSQGGLHLSDIGSAGSTISFTYNQVNSILVIRPNGDEFWTPGTEENIEWAGFGNIDTVILEYTTDNGSSWNTIADSIDASLNSYSWSVPNVSSYNYKIRISDVNDPAAGDESDDVFAVMSPVSYRLNYADTLFTEGYPGGVDIIDNIAYVADGFSGLTILDITIPGEGEILSTFDTPGNAVKVAVQENHAYVADELGGLRIIDISDPQNPSESGALVSGGIVKDVFVDDSLVYLAENMDGLRIVNVSDKSNPVTLGRYDTPGYTASVTVRGEFAYLADQSNGFVILSVADPVNPQLIKAFGDIGWIVDVELQDDYAYLAARGDGLIILNIADQFNPYETGRYTRFTSAANITLSDDYAFYSAETDGLRVIDITDPSNPAEAAFYNTPGWAYQTAIKNDYLYIADQTSWLFVVQTEFPVGITDPVNSSTPDKFALHQNYPNPFNPSTTISFTLPEHSNTSLIVYDVLGREITELVDEGLAPGTYEYQLKSSDIDGGLSSGIYFYRLRTESFSETRKMILMK